MEYISRILVALFILCSGFLSAQDPWINEIHYDNGGTDTNEGVEIAGPAGMDLTCYDLVFYNGSNGQTYATINLSGIIPDEGCGFGAIWFAQSPVQNENEGIALYYDASNSGACGGSDYLVQFLGYEGGTTATNGPGVINGQTTTDIGVSEASGSPVGNSLQLTGSGASYAGFSWSGSSASSPGNLNNSQTISPCASHEINISSPSPGSITVGCSSDGSGTVDYSLIDAFDPTNDFTLELSDASGSFSSPTIIGSLNNENADGTINYTIPANFPSGTYLVRIVSNNPTVISDTTTLTITNDCYTTVDAVNGGPFTIDCDGPTTDNGTIDYTTGSNYNGGNTFTVLLSNASGDFSNSMVIGTSTSTTGGSINITIPDNLQTGSGYQIQIVSDNPVTTSSPSSSFTITQLGNCIPPHLTSVIINSCQSGPCPEGDNEIVFGNTGDYSLEATSANIDLGYGTVGTILTDDYTESLITNTSTTALLNDSAGCPGLFVEGTGATMPPNSSFIIVNENICVDALFWSSLCGAGPIYVIYTNDGTWGSSGNFSNSADGIRYFDLNTTTTDGSTFNEDYDFNSDDLTLHADGDYVSFPPLGGSATEYGNNGCTLSPVLLGSELIHFYGVNKESNNHLYWKTSSEDNNDYFEVFHSVKGYNWSSIGTVAGNGTTTLENNYRLIHQTPSPGTNYYKLTSTDFDGKKHYKGIIQVDAPLNFAYFDQVAGKLIFENKTSFEIYSFDGKMIMSGTDCTQIDFKYKGAFIIRDLKSNISQRILIY